MPCSLVSMVSSTGQAAACLFSSGLASQNTRTINQLHIHLNQNTSCYCYCTFHHNLNACSLARKPCLKSDQTLANISEKD